MEYICQYIFSEKFFLRTFSICKTISNFFLNRRSDGMWDCQRALFVGDFIEKNLLTKFESHINGSGPLIKL